MLTLDYKPLCERELSEDGYQLHRRLHSLVPSRMRFCFVWGCGLEPLPEPLPRRNSYVVRRQPRKRGLVSEFQHVHPEL